MVGIIPIREAEHNGEMLVLWECRSAQVCAALVTTLKGCGVLSADRLGQALRPGSVWEPTGQSLRP